MIENPFLTLRALILHMDSRRLKYGLINFLKEMEVEHMHAETAIGEDCDGGEDCECDDIAAAFMLEPYTIADRIFQYVTFGRAQEPLDGHEGEVFTPDEIDRIVAEFSEQLKDSDEETP